VRPLLFTALVLILFAGSHTGVCSAVSNEPWLHLSSGPNGIARVLTPSAAIPMTSGSPWVEMGGSATAGGVSNTGAGAFAPSLATDQLGRLFVAWTSGTAGADQVYLKFWNGSAWAELGGSASGGGISATLNSSDAPSLAIDASGNPAVAWNNDTAGIGEIYFRRWNGSSWIELAGSGTSGGISANVGDSTFPRLALDAQSNPVVTWTDKTNGNYQIYLRRWNGSSWVELGGSATGSGISGTTGTASAPSIALDPSGNPVVAWFDNSSGNYEIYVRRWNGTSWIELAGSGTAGGISANAGDSSYPCLTLDANGNPVVAWNDDTPSTGLAEIYLKRWNGSAWVELGGSATSGGISANSGNSANAVVALASNGDPVVAWSDPSSGNEEIYLKRWDGSNWIELGASASSGGISNNAGASKYPSIVIDAGGNPAVAWGDALEIYLRRWTLSTPPSSLQQYFSDGVTPISLGEVTNVSSLRLGGVVSAELPSTTVRIQVEARPIGTSFLGVPNGDGSLVASGTPSQAVITGLANQQYHWQARVQDSLGHSSDWVSFGANAEFTSDFEVLVPGSGGGGGGCGVLGVEVAIILAAGTVLRLIKNRS